MQADQKNSEEYVDQSNENQSNYEDESNEKAPQGNVKNRFQRFFRKVRDKLNNATIIILFGFIFLLLSLWLESNIESTITVHPDDSGTYTINSHGFLEFLINFLSHIGIGFFVFGGVSVLLDMDHWMAYFRERLSEVVIHKTYLKTISKDRLISLQSDVLSTYFDNDSIGGDEGFLKYYQNNIQQIIASPIRIDVNATLLVKYLEGSNKSKIEVIEEISWRCKSNKGEIQPDIKWIPEPGEFDDVTFMHIKLEHPSFQEDEHTNKREKFIKQGDKNLKTVEDGFGFVYTIQPDERQNGLKVTVKVKFQNPTERLIAWRMAHISKGVSISVLYPSDLKAAKEIFVLGRDESYSESFDETEGYYRWSSDGNWVLPNEGVAFQMLFQNKSDIRFS